MPFEPPSPSDLIEEESPSFSPPSPSDLIQEEEPVGQYEGVINSGRLAFKSTAQALDLNVASKRVAAIPEMQKQLADTKSELDRFNQENPPHLPDDPSRSKGRYREELQHKIFTLNQQLEFDRQHLPKLLGQISQRQKDIEQIRVSPVMEQWGQAKSGKEAASVFIKDPIEVTSNILVQGFAGSTPALAGGAIGSIGGRAGSALGAGLGSYAVESSTKIMGLMQEAGIDIKDPEQVVRAFQDKETMAKWRNLAMRRGIPVATFDALTAGLAGKFLEPAIGKGFKPVVKGTVKEIGIQAGGGAAGELAGQVSAGEDIDPKAIFEEAIAEVASGPSEIVSNLREERARQKEGQNKFVPPKPEDVAEEPKVVSPEQPVAPAEPEPPEAPPAAPATDTAKEEVVFEPPTAPAGEKEPGSYLVFDLKGQPMVHGPFPEGTNLEEQRTRIQTTWPDALFRTTETVSPVAPPSEVQTPALPAVEKAQEAGVNVAAAAVEKMANTPQPTKLQDPRTMSNAEITREIESLGYKVGADLDPDNPFTILKGEDQVDFETDEFFRRGRGAGLLRVLEQRHKEIQEEHLGAILDERDETVPEKPTVVEVERPKATIEPTPQIEAPKTGSPALADWVRTKLEPSAAFSNQELFDEADKHFGGTQSQGKYTPKDAYDAMELGVNKHILESPERYNPADASVEKAAKIVEDLKNLVKNLPTQSKRTEEQNEFQQFSTPPSLGFVVSWVGNPKANDVVLEPSAGIGGLAVFPKLAGANVVVNELSPRRSEVLRQLNFDQQFQENAEQINNILPKELKFDLVVMNPPFSSTAGRKAGERKTKNATVHLEQALKRLKPGGRLVAIVGEGMSEDRPSFRDWWSQIKKAYTVRANIGVSGKNYGKYGTQFGNQILVIDNTGAQQGQTVTGNVENIEDLLPLLEPVRNERQTKTEAGPAEPPRAATPAVGTPAAQPANPPTAPANEVRPGLRGTGAPPEVRQPTGGNLPKPSGNAPGGSPAIPDNLPERRPAEPAPVSGGVEPTGSVGTPVGGPAPSIGGEIAGVSYESTGLTESVSEEESSVYEEYRPQVAIPGARKHPSPLAESAAMASVGYPQPDYKPKLPENVIKEGLLSGAQLETTILAGQAHQGELATGERRGFFIGDGTGVGKGREIASIIWDNWNQGRKKAVWLSENGDLAKDAGRDMRGIGWTSDVVMELSDIKAGQPITAKEGVLFATYGTLRSAEKIQKQKEGGAEPVGQSRLEQIVKWLGKDFDGVIAFDEAHNMGNAVEMKSKRGKSKPSQKALAGVELQKQLPKARVVYVSATGATEVSNLAYATRLGVWGEGTDFPGVTSFINDIASGGVAAMELVARDLKALGLYLARTLSFNGVTYEKLTHTLSPAQRENWDQLAGAWQIVLQNLNSALETTQANQDFRAKSAAMSAFWSAHQRFFNQIITAMQTPTMIKDMQKNLAAGKAILIQLTNTNEAATERQLAAKQAEGNTDLEDLDITPRDLLVQYLDRAFPTAQFETYIDENGNERTRPVKDSQGNIVRNPEAEALREHMKMMIGAISFPDAPLDMIVNTFGPDKVAEITGRKRRIIIGEEGKKEVQKRGEAAISADAEGFMADLKQILIFSEKGGTGRSYHADLTAKNQRKRVHYLLQPGWRADKAVQGFGRSHRSNQKQPPHYVLVQTDLKAQKRFISSIARRLDQLGALTKGQRQTGSQGFFDTRDNLESQYAKDALEKFFVDLANGQIPEISMDDFTAQTGLTVLTEQGQIREDLPPITQFLNRLLSLKTDLMDKVFEAFGQRMDELISHAIEAGTLDQGLETVKALNVRVLKEQKVYTHPETKAETNYVQLELTHPSRIMKWEDAKKVVKFGFVVNKASGQIWAVTHAIDRTASDGGIAREYRMASPRSSHFVPKQDLNAEKYEKVDEAKAEALWETSVKNTPPTFTEQKHLITGIILPIWKRLKGNPKIMRVTTEDGRKLIGRLVPEAQLNTVLQALGAETQSIDISPADAVNKILEQNVRIYLANGWYLKRSLVSGDNRIEIVGPEMGVMPELKRHGIITELINFKTRFFIPTGGNAADIFSKITKNRPVLSIDGAGSPSSLPQNPPPTQVDQSARRIEEELNKPGGIKINLDRPKDEGGFIDLSIVADLIRVGTDFVKKGFNTFSTWSRAMVKNFGDKIKGVLEQIWQRIQNVQIAQALGLTPKGVEHKNRIEAIAEEVNKKPDVQPVYDQAIHDTWRMKLARTSRRLVYFGSENLLREKQLLDLKESYQSTAVKNQADNLMDALFKAAYKARPNEWKLPELFRIGEWARRVKRFKKLSLPLAAHLNVTGKNANGWIFRDFDMRAGFMTERQFKAGKHQLGDQILVRNPLTGAMQELTIASYIQTQDRKGYQLIRPMPASEQQELYNHYSGEYPELMWLVDMFIDPALAKTRQTINGIQIPVFNRFSLATMMAENNPTFQAIDAYTPDVMMVRSLMGAVRGALGLRRGTKSPGRKYKTGASRESGNVRDLLSGFNIRTFQMLQEEGRKRFFQSVMKEAKPIHKGIVPDGWVKVDTGIDEIWNAIKKLRNWNMPVEPQTGNPVFPETEARLKDDQSAEFKAFFGEAARLRGKQLMIPKPLLDMLAKQYAAHREVGLLGRMFRYLIRNTVQLYLVHPKTYVANVLTNDLFALEAAYRYGMAGVLRANPTDIRFASNIVAGMALHRFRGLRELVHIADKTNYLKTVREILPDNVFADATQLSDVKVKFDDRPLDLLRKGEIGGAALQLIAYGNIDVRAKQRMAYAFLKAQAVRVAKASGATGPQLRAKVQQFMQNPPMEERTRAVAAANFELLNYADSPEWLNQFSRNEWFRLVLPFPRFGYHFLAKQGQRLSALKLFLGKVPRGKRAEAFADLVTLATFGLGGGGLILDAAVRGLAGADDDDDDDARKRYGTSVVKYVDEDGNIKTKPIDRSQVTSNRINLSYWARLMGIDDANDKDYWLRIRNYPVVAMAGAAVLAMNDAKKFGAAHGTSTYLQTVTDLAGDFFSTGMIVKVPAKAAASLQELASGEPEKSLADPYATNIPFSAYLTSQLMDSFVPGSRQFDEVVIWMDPIERRKTASKTLEYQPGPLEALQADHFTGILDRMMRGGESDLPPAGKIDRKIGEVLEPREISLESRISSLLGFNIKTYDREQYEKALKMNALEK
jgi:predicted RNA methylase